MNLKMIQFHYLHLFQVDGQVHLSYMQMDCVAPVLHYPVLLIPCIHASNAFLSLEVFIIDDSYSPNIKCSVSSNF